MQNLEAETELKQIHLCLKREPKCQTKKLTRKTVKPSIDWMETQKPGMHPPPDSNKCKVSLGEIFLFKRLTEHKKLFRNSKDVFPLHFVRMLILFLR